MATRIQLRGDTAVNWSSTNPTLALSELGFETTGSRRFKVGDGSTPWNALAYFNASAVPYDDSGASITAATVQAAIDAIAGMLDDADAALAAFDLRIDAVEADYLDVDSAQTISGAKTFSVPPIVPTPAAGGEATPKSYVDDKADAAVGDARSTSVQKSGDTMTGRLVLLAVRETSPSVITGTGTVNINPVNGTLYRIDTSASFTLALAAPALGDSISVRINKTSAGHVVTLPSANIRWLDGEVPDLADVGHHWLTFWAESGHWCGAYAGNFLVPA